jgi:hypothetical protein
MLGSYAVTCICCPDHYPADNDCAQPRAACIAATSPGGGNTVVSQDQLLQLQAQYDAVELLAKTAEAEARAARARKTTQLLDLKTRAQALRSNSSSPRASPTASYPRVWSLPAPS